MVYYICTPSYDGRNAIFDIEFYLGINDSPRFPERKWFSELHALPCLEGYSRFLLQLEPSKVDEFIKDSEKISELRGWLWETKGGSYGEENHYKVIKPELENILNEYCTKYGLHLVID